MGKTDIVTINEVADRAGVSITTVSRVINRPYLVRGDTAKRVRVAMKELDFAPNAVAQSMRVGKTRTVGAVIPDPRNPFYSGMLCAIETELKKYDYMLIICPSSGDFNEEKQYIARMLQRRVDGIVFFTYNNSREHIRYFQRILGQVPFVLMDEARDDLGVNLVATNGYGGVRRAVLHFVERGHRKIACLRSCKEAGANRFLGYRDALLESGIEPDERYVFSCGFTPEDGYAAGAAILAMEERPTAAVCVADSMAVGLIRCMVDHGVKIPEELEVIGFDNIGLSTLISPSLSTISQKLEELSGSAVKLLMEMIGRPGKRALRPRSVLVEGELVFRSSTK